MYLIFRHYTYKYGVHIDSNIPIGKGLFIVHGDGVYLNCHSVGENFTIFQCVTVGTNGKGKPIIKDNVTLFTGALCIGDISIEDNVVVGGNAVLNKNTVTGGIYIGAPAVNIKQDDKGENKNVSI